MYYAFERIIILVKVGGGTYRNNIAVSTAVLTAPFIFSLLLFSVYTYKYIQHSFSLSFQFVKS